MNDKNHFIAMSEGWFSVGVNILLFLLKYWAGLVTGSIALIADAWHTLSDSISSVIVILGYRIKSKPADQEHPFGHGRAELIAALIIGVLLATIAFNFLIESIRILQNHEPVVFGNVAIIVTIISILMKEAMAQYALWAAKRLNSNALRADGWHHRSDSISSIIILIGIFIGPYFWWIDGALGIAVSIFIFHTSYSILMEAINPLLGELPDPDMIQKIKSICDNRIKIDANLHHFHIHRYGDHSELTFHIKLPGEFSLDKAHDIATEIETEINDKFNIETTIHMEPS